MRSAIAPSLESRKETVERLTAREDSALVDVVDLLIDGTALADWPEQYVNALGVALSEPENRIEAQKARVLRYHLFRRGDGAKHFKHPSAPSATCQRLAERLRSDLPGCVSLGVARHISDFPQE